MRKITLSSTTADIGCTATATRQNKFSSGFKFLSILLLVLMVSGKSWGQVNISVGNTIGQNFDGIGSSATATLPSGWKASTSTTLRSPGTYTSAVTATTVAGAASIATNAASGIYNFGNSTTTTDRAVGGLSGGSTNKNQYIYVDLLNNGVSSISSFSISYNVEKYRDGTNSAGFSIQMFYSNDGTTWTSAGTDFLTSFAGGNATNGGYVTTPGSTQSVTTKTLTQTITTSNHLYLCWNYCVTTGTTITNAQGLGIDDVSITANGIITSTASDIIASASFTYPTNIAYSSYQGTAPLTTGNSIEVGQFDIRDGGATTDADALATTLTGLTLNVANSAGLRRIALFDGSTNLGEVAAGATATFSGLTLAAADNSTKTFSVRASFLSSVTDNQQFSFTVNSATASGAGSGFATGNAGAAVTSTSGDNNRIEVTASDIIFDQSTSTVALGAVMSPSPTLRAIDANVNYDLDYTGAFTLGVTTGTATFDGTATTSGSFAAGVATLSNLKFNASGTGNVITATSGSFTDATSAFNVTDPQPEINIKQGVTSITTAGSYGFGSQLSGSSTSAVTFTIENLGTADLSLSGTPKVAISGTNASEFTIDQTSTSATVGASGTTTFTITFSPTSQGSKTAAISIANNDGTGSENPYIINLTGTGTVSAVSDIANTSGYSYTSNVAYASYQTASTLTAGNSVGATGITIRDGAGTTDDDNLGTTLTAISFTTGGSTAIRTAALFDGSTNVSEVAVNGATTISFTGLSLTAADNGTKDLVLRVTYMAAVTDNQQITFTVSTATASTAGSVFAAANAGGAASTSTSDINRIEVNATQLAFVQQPSTAVIGGNMTPAVTVKAIDANTITDLDFIGDINITSTGTLSSSPQTSAAVAGIATFSSVSHSATGSGLNLTAASSGLTSVESGTFNVTVQAAGELLLEENFNYTSATNLTANGWSGHSSAGTSSVKVHTSGLTNTGYGSTGLGNAAIINASGEDINRTFTQQNTGTTTYSSFLVNVTSATSGGDYIVHLGPTTIATEFRCRFYTKYASSNLTFGISTNGTTTVYAPTNFVYGTTYLVVIKHFFNGSTQTSSLYVNPSLTAEPALPDATETSSTNLSTNIGSVAIRQSSSSNVAIIDGIRVATNWGVLLGNPTYDGTSDIATGNYNNVTLVSGGAVTQTGNVAVNSLSLNSGSTLNVSAGKQLTVSTSLTNNGTLNLKSSASGTATILTPATIGGSGTTNVEQYLTGGRNWYISSPLTDAESSTIVSAIATTTAGYGLQSYTESNATWESAASTLAAKKGYVAKSLASDITLNFTGGTLNTGTQSISLNRTDSAITKRGFNLVGNPYPSYLNWELASRTLVNPTMWYRAKNSGGSSYIFDTYGAVSKVGTSLNGTAVTAYIPPMQAFWVRVTGGGAGTVVFENSMRAHEVGTNRMKAPAVNTQQVLRLQVSNVENCDEAIVLFNSNASDSYDDYDSPKMSNANAAIPEIFTTVGGEQLVINGMNSAVIANRELPLGFTTGASNNFTIKATEISNFDADTRVILKDNVLKAEYELNVGNAYNFSSDAVNTTSRFSIVFRSATGPNALYDNNFSTLYIGKNSNNQITINGVGAKDGMVTVCNAVGQKLISTALTGSSMVIDKPFSTGVYLVTVNVGNAKVTKKVIVN